MHEKNGATKKYVDLHIHSTFSDGEYSVKQIVDSAIRLGLKAIAITDHDTINAYPAALELAGEQGIEIISGAEFSCSVNNVDVHILGYLLDNNNEALKSKLAEMKDARFDRAKRIVHNLNRQGVDLRFETVLKVAGDGAIGRPHIATAMLQEELIYSFKEAFEKYIGYDSPAYVGKMELTPEEVFRLILDAQGIPVIAHPGITNIDHLIPRFIQHGLMGVEAYHSEHPTSVKNHYMEYAKRYNLLITGGSDFHSKTQTRAEIGLPRVPYSIIEQLYKRYEQLFGKSPVVCV